MPAAKISCKKIPGVENFNEKISDATNFHD